MAEEKKKDGVFTRREFLRATGAGAMMLGLGSGSRMSNASDTSGTEDSSQQASLPSSVNGPYNILFILTDQERYFQPGELPVGYSLPGRERVQKQGTSFVNHRINSCVCTPSRSVIYTGQHIQHTKMFDNTNFPWGDSMSTEIPTLGDMLREAGYYTAYKGKWHLTKEFETVNREGRLTKIFTEEMEAYGFSDYVGVGDIIAHHLGGYRYDGVTAAMTGSWLRGKGRELAAQGKPWFLAVNLVNPHDVMFYNTDAPGTRHQEQIALTHVVREPDDPLYAKRWDFRLPENHGDQIDAPGRPTAHRDFLRSHDALVGEIPDETSRWIRRHNYYLNCLRDVDRNIVTILTEIEDAGLADKTIIVLTADHGDMDAAHRLHAKGAVSYREQNHVPLIVSHPAYPGGNQCRAITSHADIAPSLVALTGVDPERRARIVKGLPGKDFSSLLAAPEQAGINALHDGVLFNYNMFAYLDGDFLYQAVAFIKQGGNPRELKTKGIVPDMMKRGAVRSVFDGRYVFARYFSPKQHNRPRTMEEILRYNDIELYDHETDPLEMNNLAMDQNKNGELILAMNDRLNGLIDAEVGEDRGQMLPGGLDAGWDITPETMAP